MVKDFVTGVFMLLEDQYGVGDTVDLGDATGEVQSVGLRITTVRDIDGTLWYVRNGGISRVGNMSQYFAVARVEVPVALTADVDRVEQVALDAAHEVIADPTIGHMVKTKPNAQWSVQRRLRRAVLRAYDEHGVDRRDASTPWSVGKKPSNAGCRRCLDGIRCADR
nr:mechanosensitive ion channel domain-containing protein [Mycobacterium sp. 155]